MPTLPPPAPAPAGGPAPLPCRGCGRVYPAERLQCPTDGTVLPLEGRLLDHKFRLDRKVGDGGMASVWQATNTFVHRTVAIKLMHARYASDAELLGRFRNEASAAGKIGSPHICDVLDFGQSEIGPYIVLELLEGCSLAELITTAPPPRYRPRGVDRSSGARAASRRRTASASCTATSSRRTCSCAG